MGVTCVVLTMELPIFVSVLLQISLVIVQLSCVVNVISIKLLSTTEMAAGTRLKEMKTKEHTEIKCADWYSYEKFYPF